MPQRRRPAGRATGIVKHERAALSRRFVARDGIQVCAVRLNVRSAPYADSIDGKGYAQFGRVRLVNLPRLGLA